MLYNMDIPPEYIKGITTFTGKHAEFPAYTLFTIDKESYIVKGVIENSDEGFSHTDKMIHNLQIGRYCSVANDVHFLIGRGKNYRRISTSNAKILHSAPSVKNDYREKGSIIIENDVWIGRKSFIMAGVTVHNGAVIAANSHVVKDVPPYAIVGGNPARVIGYRFDKESIDKLQMIQWWYWSDEKISENAEYFNDDIEAFCDRFYPEAKEEFERKYAGLMEDKDRYLMVVDYGDNYSVLEPLLDEFISQYFGQEQKELVLFALEERTEEAYIKELTGIIDSILAEPGMEAAIRVESGDMESAKRWLTSSRHLIINRMPCTVELMSFAGSLGDRIEVISGVDSKIL